MFSWLLRATVSSGCGLKNWRELEQKKVTAEKSSFHLEQLKQAPLNRQQAANSEKLLERNLEFSFNLYINISIK